MELRSGVPLKYKSNKGTKGTKPEDINAIDVYTGEVCHIQESVKYGFSPTILAAIGPIC